MFFEIDIDIREYDYNIIMNTGVDERKRKKTKRKRTKRRKKTKKQLVNKMRVQSMLCKFSMMSPGIEPGSQGTSPITLSLDHIDGYHGSNSSKTFCIFESKEINVV